MNTSNPPPNMENTTTKSRALSASDLFDLADCRECGSRNLTWHCQPHNLGGVQDGRIRMHEVGVKFFLGCNECHETLLIKDGDTIAAALTEIHSETNESK